MTGIDLIAKERARQIDEEGFDSDHDKQHDCDELPYAAICYAAPENIFRIEALRNEYHFIDPWPESWDDEWDKRPRHSSGRLIHSDFLLVKERIRNLTKAGALIAAEIDRLLRTQE